MPRPKVGMSLAQSRKAISAQMSSNSRGKIEEKVIRFRNDDVPKFLKSFDKFEKKSRKTRIVVK